MKQITIESAIQSYLDFMEIQEPSPYTLRNRKTDLRKLQEFAISYGTVNMEDLTADQIVSFHKSQTKAGMAPTTWNKVVSSLREFFRWAGPNGQKIIDSDFSGCLMRRKEPGRPIETVTGKTWRHITGKLNLKAQRKDQGNSFQSYTNSRLHLIWHMLSVEGLRVGELVSIDLPSISYTEDAHRASISIKGKGMRYRMIPLEDVSCELLKNYLVAREEYLASRGASSIHLFLSSQLNQISRRQVQILIHSLGESFDTNLACHKLRKTAVSRAINNASADVQLAVIVKQFGHTVSVAEKYYLNPDQETAANAKLIA